MQRALAVAALAACLLAAGCGWGEKGAATTAGSAATESTAPSPPGGSGDGGESGGSEGTGRPGDAEVRVPDADPAETLSAYFDDLAAGDTDAAWALLSPRVRRQLGGFDTWSLGIEQREATTLTSAEPVGGDEAEPAFAVVVDTVERAPCDVTAERTFTGTWTLEPDPGNPGDPASWRIASVEQTLTAGPPDLETLCTSASTGSTQ